MQTDRLPVTPRMQVHQRRTRRTQHQPRGQTLQRPGGEQPHHRVGQHEPDARHHQRAEPDHQHRRRPAESDTGPATTSVASTPNAYTA